MAGEPQPAALDLPGARTDSPGATGSDYSGRDFYSFINNLWTASGGYSQVGDRFNPEVGFLPRRGYRRPEMRLFFQPQPKKIKWIRGVSPHMSASAYYGLDGVLQSTSAHFHPFEIQPATGGRFGFFFDHAQDRPTRPFVVYNRDRNRNRVVIPVGNYDWWQQAFEYLHDPSAVVTWTSRVRLSHYYDGDFKALELTGATRIGSRFTSSVGLDAAVEGPAGRVVRRQPGAGEGQLRVHHPGEHPGAGPVQRPDGRSSHRTSAWQSSTAAAPASSFVYNDRRDRTTTTPEDTLGRSFVIKYTRMLDS